MKNPYRRSEHNDSHCFPFSVHCGHPSGTLIREYVWNGLTPVAVIEGGAVYFIRTDHIGKPVFATDSLGTKVWQVAYDPFGGLVASTGTPSNIRFPGQWFQSESGLHQNWMRDYDPTTGRYLQADPLGLIDGASVYGYARQNPGRWVDPTGEAATGLGNTDDGRSFTEHGPINGNWGGGCWSGGQYSCGPNGEGTAEPIDSGDECYQRHDNYYTKCNGNGSCMKICDRKLVDELRNLPDEPRDWPRPPPPGTEETTKTFRDGAINLFGGGEQ